MLQGPLCPCEIAKDRLMERPFLSSVKVDFVDSFSSSLASTWCPLVNPETFETVLTAFTCCLHAFS